MYSYTLCTEHCEHIIFLPLIVKSAVDVTSNLNPALSKIICDIEVTIGSVVGNSISLLSWVPDQGVRINSVGKQVSSCPCGTFILGYVDGRLGGVSKDHLKLQFSRCSEGYRSTGFNYENL